MRRIMTLVFICCVCQVYSQTEINATLASRYICRGSDIGDAPTIHPEISHTMGQFKIGIWAAYELSNNEHKTETYELTTDASGEKVTKKIIKPDETNRELDFYLKYTTQYGTSFGLYDFYIPNGKFTDYSSTGAHILELALMQTVKSFELDARISINDTDVEGGQGVKSNTIYLSSAYKYKNFYFFVAGGNKNFTKDGNFNLVNTGVEYSKDVKIGDDYKINLASRFTYNPEKDLSFLTFYLTM